MIDRRPHIDRLDKAVATITEARNRRSLAENLCRAIATGADVATVVLAEIDSGSTLEIARFERQPPQSSPPDQPKTVLNIPSATVPTAIVFDEPLDAGQRETALFLIDVATATAERLDSEDRLRLQQIRLRSLGADIRGLESALTDSADHDDKRASEFAAAAALLTDRERDILEHILEGASNASIAETYTLSVETVKTHVKHILRKMGVANRAELIARSV